jgi:orotidine-5'-phosphate decarboxylase
VRPFGARLRAAVAAHGPLCAGIDPHPGLLRDWGLGDDVAGLERFARTAVDALAGAVAVVKPQSAFFERFGSRGIAVLERVLADARAAGAIVLLDVKRGDIGSTVTAYADAYLDPASPLGADAVTASPYLGFGALRPLLDTARRHGRGVFVLALTSNPEGAAVQRAIAMDGRTVAQHVLDAAAAENTAEFAAHGGLGSVGVVVGATVGAGGHDLTRLRGPILAPGVGAQGAALADLPAAFGPVLPNVLPSVSRDLLRHGPDPVRLRHAAERLREQAVTATAGPDGPVRAGPDRSVTPGQFW